MYDSYLELPMRIFYQILRDEGQKSLLANGEEVSQEQLDSTWEKIKKEYQENHRSAREEMAISYQAELMSLHTLLTRDTLLVETITRDMDAADEFLAIAGYKTLEELGKAIEKRNSLIKIKSARFKKWVEEEKKDPQAISEFNIYDALSSIEHTTGLKLDYQTVTCGEFDAKQRLAQKIVDHARRQNKTK